MSFSRGQALRIVIAGGSGQMGRSLAAHFQASGHHVTVLTRAPYTANWPTVYWPSIDGKGEHYEADRPDSNWISTLEGADVLVNLCGSSIARLWTRRNRHNLHESRIGSTELLGEAMATLDQPPRLWMNASAAAIGTQPPNRPAVGVRGSLSRLIDRWEATFFSAPAPATRKIALRSALFLSAEPGNRFRLLSHLALFGLGGTLGSGRQTVGWIHADDFARAIDFLIEHEELDGPFNLSAPEPLPNRAFMAVLREAWDRPNGMPWPRPLLYLLSRLCRADAELALYSCHALPGQLERAGFRFEFPDWPSAAEDLVRQYRELEG
jgi:hypothetical protein